MSGNTSLVKLLHREIQQSGGRISFERFMELALYHPKLGYYTSGAQRVGKAGDFFTNVSVGPLFGRLLAEQFLKFRAELGTPDDFEVVEYGGHRGELRADVLSAAPNLRYRVIEASDSPPDSIVGCVFSNEFLDALPVHRLTAEGGVWKEIHVTTGTSGEFEEIAAPLSTPRLVNYLKDLPVDLMDGYQTEVNLRALDWLADIAHRLRKGVVLTIDYGYDREEFFSPRHRDGTLQCYHRHTKSSDPYQHIGEQDITAHVEFTSLIEHGKKVGLEPILYTDQAHYLLQIGEERIAEIVQRTAGTFSKERAAIHQLIHPELMGRAFRVLIQRKSPYP